MIRDAQEKDKAAIYALWQTSFSLKSSDYLNCFFNNVYDFGRTILCEYNSKIVSTVHMQEFVMNLHSIPIKAIYCSQIATHPDYRRSGFMQECMESCLDECDKKVLFTFVEASNPKFFEQYGFQEACVHRTYDLQAKYFEKISPIGISDTFTAKELLMVYNSFIKHFDGYRVRNEIYFERMMKECIECGENLIVYRNNEGVMMGYARSVIRNGQVKVKECVYQGSIALCKLLKASISHYPEIHLEVSEAEHFDKVFPLCISRKRVFTMVKCNNLGLFNKVYNAKAKSSLEAYTIGDKPIYMNERY